MTLDQMKTIKKNFGISVREISENTEVPFGTVQKIFTGETENPRFATLYKLNEFFVEFSLKYLDEMPEEPVYVHDSHMYIPPDSSAGNWSRWSERPTRAIMSAGSRASGQICRTSATFS